MSDVPELTIAIASGKGGTGKTTVAANLALAAAGAGQSVAYLDCDVEEPNGALFLSPTVEQTRPVEVGLPVVDAARCTACGRCGEICQFSAIVPINGRVLVYPELCHNCGGCRQVCPAGAISEGTRTTGEIQLGRAGAIGWVQGLLNVGEAMSPPVISAVRAAAPPAELGLIDCPPGTSCPVIEAVRGTDLVVLVTEPTPFGFNDLKLAVEMVRALALPFGVVINRCDAGDGQTLAYCRQQNVPVLAELPDDRRVAEAYSRGELACRALPEYRTRYTDLLAAARARAAAEPVSAVGPAEGAAGHE